MITTKTGDTGYTDIFQKRVRKDDPIIEVLGTIDECIAQIVLLYNLDNQDILKQIVDDLSLMAAIVSGYTPLDQFTSDKISYLETKESINLQKFQYPFHNKLHAEYNIARTSIRRLERLSIRHLDDCFLTSNIIVYLNRLSDYLFLCTF